MYLTEKAQREAKIRTRELDVEERKIELQERQMNLEEQRLQMDKEKLALEIEERREELELQKQQLEIMVNDKEVTNNIIQAQQQLIESLLKQNSNIGLDIEIKDIIGVAATGLATTYDSDAYPSSSTMMSASVEHNYCGDNNVAFEVEVGEEVVTEDLAVEWMIRLYKCQNGNPGTHRY
ncbi:hypothetical protein FQR65_LT19101 [Abscondita terminalis]|nr:hypothetical protein FQR65_LT19101 [Abscondita terminalis]